MAQASLVREEIDAGAEFVRAFDAYAPVRAAFWMKLSDESMRYLYIASDQINDANTAKAYGEVVRLLQLLDSMYLDDYPVKLINSGHPFAQSAIRVQELLPRRSGNRFRELLVGDAIAEDVYIYPNPLPAAVT